MTPDCKGLCFSSPPHPPEPHQHHQRELCPGPNCGLQHSGCDLESRHRQDEDLRPGRHPVPLPDIGKER